jgi:hypothetical protein
MVASLRKRGLMRKAPRVCRGAETERIKSDQAVHAPDREPVPVPIIEVVVDLMLRPQIPFSAPMPKAEEISSATKHMMNNLSQAVENVNANSLMGT